MKFIVCLLFLEMAIFKAEAREKILLVPIGENIGKEVLEFLKCKLEEIFNAHVDVGDAISISEGAFNPVRNQYNSSEILRDYIKPEKYNKVLLICDVDLYTEGLNFVFGEADILKEVAIISLTRLHQDFYGLPEDKDLFKLRALKEAVHELGHLYGLRHCFDPNCVMHFSNTLLDTDKKSYKFCPSCQRKLENKIGR